MDPKWSPQLPLIDLNPFPGYLTHLGTGCGTKADEFSEKFKTAFAPTPPSISANHIAIFSRKNLHPTLGGLLEGSEANSFALGLQREAHSGPYFDLHCPPPHTNNTVNFPKWSKMAGTGVTHIELHDLRPTRAFGFFLGPLKSYLRFFWPFHATYFTRQKHVFCKREFSFHLETSLKIFV